MRRFFFFQAEDGIRDYKVTGVQTCALPIFPLQPSHLGSAGRAVERRDPRRRRPCLREECSRIRPGEALAEDRKSTRLNSSHLVISYAVFCLKKKIHIHTTYVQITIDTTSLL